MDGPRYSDEIATGGDGGQNLRIAGRVREGTEEKYVIMEEPGEAVMTHFRGKLVPHWKRNCPHCNGTDVPKALWYVGACLVNGELVILELTWKCHRAAAAAARHHHGKEAGIDLFGQPVAAAGFTGLLVTISRANFKASQRVLRCDQRVTVSEPWPYRTREELARIWGIPIRPRLFRAEEA
jgi:hypothetical protein